VRRRARVEPVVLLGIGAEPWRDVRRHDLDDPAEGVALAARRVGRRAHLVVVGLSADLPRAARDGDPDVSEKRLRDGTRRDMGGGLPRARSLERVAHVCVPVLQGTGEVGVARRGRVTGDVPFPVGSLSGGHGLMPHAQFL